MAKHNETVLLEARLSEAKAKVMAEASDDEFFQLDAIDTVLRQRNLTHQELQDGIVDRPDDGGIDAVYTFLNGELVSDDTPTTQLATPTVELAVLQVKNEGGFGETPLQKLIDHLPTLIALGADDAVLAVEFSPKVIERFGLFRQIYLSNATRMPVLTIGVTYITKAVADPNAKVKAKVARLRKTLVSEYPAAGIEISLVGAPTLNQLSRARAAQTLELRLAEQPISAELGGMVGLVRIADYFRFILSPDGKIRDSIFEENVRGYEGETNINKGIAGTLARAKDSSVDFWWLNNGVTILGSRVNLSSKLAMIEDPQIVNGLQTSRAIYNHFAQEADPQKVDDSGRHLLVRIIEATDEYISAEIIKATNSQNRVPSASLRAAEPFQRSIEEFLLPMGVFYERRRNHYKNQGEKRSAIVSVLELAQAVASIALQVPEEARGRPSSLVRDPLYSRVFNEKSPLEFYWRCLQVMRTVDRYLDVERGLGRQERSNLRFHLGRVAVAVAVTSSRPKPAAVVKVDADALYSHLEPVYDWTVAERDKVAAEVQIQDLGTLAKSKEFSARLNERLSRYSDKQKWPKMLDSGWAR